MRPAQPEVTSPLTNMDELDRGWSWVVLAASFGYFMIFGMLLYGVGIVHVTLLEEYDKPSSATAWAGSLYASLVSLGGPLSSLIIDRWSCRTAMFIDGVLTTVGLLSSAFSPSLYLVIFTYGILAGFGGGIGYTATMMVVGFNFRRWRNTALGVAISGVGVGTCIFSPILELMCGLYGRRGYFIMLAGISLHKCLFAVLCRPSRLERARQRSLKTNDEAPLSKSQIMKLYANVYANKLIICFSLSLMLFSVGTYMIFLHLPAVAVSKGHSRMTAALLLSACGASTILARIMTTFVSEKKSVDGIVLYSGSFGSLALATFLFPIYSRTLVGLVIFSAILGAYFGGCYAVMNSINIHLVSLKFLNIATGVELVFTAIGTAIGPIVTGKYQYDLECNGD
ncbi:monocarboxylate transporter 12-B-like [Dreissena polymorpha]|uniref:monocarboxylate transporter 12-B-like n=1 Tax=Dreissena polymorpha TaxID=45954 RepID=UPI002263D1D9|nr:monocarboxylate transporter 12-B-like [Dreissena polymorpha]